MLTENHSKEGLSRAYVQAVGAKAGAIVSINERGYDYGIDGSFHEVSIIGGQRMESGMTLDFQLKATSHVDRREGLIYYQLDARTVNLLASRLQKPHTTPAILILFCLPTQSGEWLQISEEELILRNCCYWSSISSLTINSHSATVQIPRCQLFTPDKLKTLLLKIPDGMTSYV